MLIITHSQLQHLSQQPNPLFCFHSNHTPLLLLFGRCVFETSTHLWCVCETSTDLFLLITITSSYPSIFLMSLGVFETSTGLSLLIILIHPFSSCIQVYLRHQLDCFVWWMMVIYRKRLQHRVPFLMYFNQ